MVIETNKCRATYKTEIQRVEKEEVMKEVYRSKERWYRQS